MVKLFLRRNYIMHLNLFHINNLQFGRETRNFTGSYCNTAVLMLLYSLQHQEGLVQTNHLLFKHT